MGTTSIQIAPAHEHITGGGFDLPPLAPVFDRRVAEHGLSERLRFNTGDFFADPLPRADVLVMGQILHGFNLADSTLPRSCGCWRRRTAPCPTGAR